MVKSLLNLFLIITHLAQVKTSSQDTKSLSGRRLSNIKGHRQ